MIDCRVCGHRNEEGTTFCARCRSFLEWTGNPVAAGPPSAISVVLKTRELEAEPGSECICELEVHNQGTIVDECRLTITGETAGWSRVEPAVLRLLPSTSGTARLAFRPPRSPEVRSGPAGFVLTAASTVHPEVTSSAAGAVTVAPFTELSATLVPQVSESTGAAEHTVEVDNQGNAPVRVAVRVVDPDDVLSIDLNESSLVVQPGQRATSHLRVAARKRGERRDGARRTFQVALLPAQGGRILLDGAFVPLARPPSWLMRHRIQVAAAAAVGLVALGGIWASAASHRPWDRPSDGSAARTPILPPAETSASPSTPGVPAPTTAPTAAAPTSGPVPAAPPSPPGASPVVAPKAQHFEAELLSYTATPNRIVVQQPNCCGYPFSGGRQLWYQAQAVGDYLALTFTVDTTGTYAIRGGVTRSFDYGMYSVTVDSTSIVPLYNAYNASVVTTDQVLSSRISLTAGRHTLWFRIVNKSSLSKGYYVGLDYLDLIPV
ncbi:MAG TPA: hypothetical protein VLW53_24585 [Candidatus Eisenbacteria bacterium]|nr:hypothetical protein [Candidatus Eisenbacteria bacterium]